MVQYTECSGFKLVLKYINFKDMSGVHFNWCTCVIKVLGPLLQQDQRINLLTESSPQVLKLPLKEL